MDDEPDMRSWPRTRSWLTPDEWSRWTRAPGTCRGSALDGNLWAERRSDVGIRKSQGKNKKSNKPTAAITVKREETLRQATRTPRSKARPA